MCGDIFFDRVFCEQTNLAKYIIARGSASHTEDGIIIGCFPCY